MSGDKKMHSKLFIFVVIYFSCLYGVSTQCVPLQSYTPVIVTCPPGELIYRIEFSDDSATTCPENYNVLYECYSRNSCTVHVDNYDFFSTDPFTVEAICRKPEKVCGSFAENNILDLSCPSPQTIISIDFASYGVAEGNCTTGFSIGSCHSPESFYFARDLCPLSTQACYSVPFQWGSVDPCPMVSEKRIYLELSCFDLAPV